MCQEPNIYPISLLVFLDYFASSSPSTDAFSDRFAVNGLELSAAVE